MPSPWTEAFFKTMYRTQGHTLTLDQTLFGGNVQAYHGLACDKGACHVLTSGPFHGTWGHAFALARGLLGVMCKT